MRSTIAASLLIAMAFFLCCKSSKPITDAPKPAEQYNYAPEQQAASSLTIPVNIAVQDLVKSLNSRVAGTLYEDYSFDDNGGDGLMLKAVKAQDIDLFLSGQTLKYRVPLGIWLKKKLFVGAAEAQGEIALNFKTTFQIQNDWSLATQTEVEYHEWVKKPVLRTGLGDLGIEGIANIFLNRSKRELATQIDRIVREQMSLRPYIQEVWTALQTPTLLSPEYQMWLKTTPTAISMTPLVSDWASIRTKISVDCLNDVTFGEKPSFRQNSALPGLNIVADAPDTFALNFATDVPFPEAERLARNMMVGQTFGEGKQKVKVEGIELWGNNDRVVVNTQLSGAFNGKIYFIGKPTFNQKMNQIEIANLDYHIETKNFLHRSASWLLKGLLKNQMAKAMTFPLDENINGLKKSVQETLNNYQIQPGVVLTGTLEDVRVLGTSVTPTSIVVNLFARGKVNVDVKGL